MNRVSTIAKHLQRRCYSKGAMEDIVITNTAAHQATVIFMHGLGDTGLGWEEPMQMISRAIPSLKIVLPSAPVIPVSLNMGQQMPAWYDIKGLGSRANEQCLGIDESAARIRSLIDAEMAAEGQSGNVLVCGFSQGGAMALYTGLQVEDPRVLGVAALSSYLPCPTAFAEKAVARKDIPLLMCHGQQDQVVQLQWAQQSKTSLEQDCSFSVDFQEYPGMGHELHQPEFVYFVEWMQKALKGASSA